MHWISCIIFSVCNEETRSASLEAADYLLRGGCSFCGWKGRKHIIPTGIWGEYLHVELVKAYE